MNQICLMKNSIQPYAWGSHTAIASLLGQPVPSHHPQAELWMGAHHKAPSQIWYQERWQALDQLISQYPAELLGPEVSARFDKRLPFLFKVLAADQPLSLKAHPDKAQAQAGFQHENASGIAIDALHRNYKDDQHKPECICALTPFRALCGFRSIPKIMALLGPVWPSEFNSALTILTKKGIKSFLRHILTLDQNPRAALIKKALQNLTAMQTHTEVVLWILRLAEHHKHDIGVLSPMLLNFVKLAPGQAIYLPAGQLHVYLDGVGIEVMANCDNTIRGGLTPKHVDVLELLKVLDFRPRKPKIMEGGIQRTGERLYPSQAAEFVLSLFQVSDGHPCSPTRTTGVPEVLLCYQGRAVILWSDGAQRLDLSQGQSALVPAGIKRYSVSGKATLYRAAVNS